MTRAGRFTSIGWMRTLPDKPDRQTASAIKVRIQSSNYFIFLATPNSVKSRWCPWEIGYADGVRKINSIFVVTTQDASGTYGNEYLGLYKHIDFTDKGQLAAWMPGEVTGGVFVRNL